MLPGTIDADGKVISVTSSNIDVAVHADRLQAISMADRLVLRATLNTPQKDSRSVRILEENEIKIGLLVQTELEISF